MEILDTQTALRQLAERLACEYTATIPAGRVLGLVVMTGHRLRRAGHRGTALVALTETGARAELTRLNGSRPLRRRTATADPSGTVSGSVASGRKRPHRRRQPISHWPLAQPRRILATSALV